MGISIPKITTPKIEDVACQLIDKQYQLVLKMIDKILATIRWPFELLCSLIQSFKSFLENTFKDIMGEVTDFTNSLIDFAFGPLNQLKDDFCVAAYKCKAFVDNMTDPKKSPLYLFKICSKSQLESIRKNYDGFAKWVCNGPGLGEGLKQLADLINKFLEDVMLFCTKKLDAMTAKIWEAKEKLEELMRKLGLFELLDQLEAFMQCSLGICDFTYSAMNAVEDYKTRYYLVKNGEAWEMNDNITESVMDNKNDMLSEMSAALDDVPWRR
jgi:hypothetical protein